MFKAVRADLDCVGFRRGLFGVAGIEVDEGDDGERLAKRVNGHDVVSGIKGQAGRLESREEGKKAEESFAKSVGIMFGSGMKERKEGQIAACIGNQVQIIAGIIKVAGRIPANVAVGLREETRTGAAENAFGGAVADFMAAFPRGGHNGRSVSRKGCVFRLNDAAKNGLVQETSLKDGKKRGVWLFVDEKVREGKPLNEFLCRFLLHAVGFLSLVFRFLHFGAGRLNMVREIFLRAVPQTGEKIIERPDARRIVRREPAEDGVKRRDAHGVNPCANRGNVESQRQQVRTEHTGGRARFWTKDGISVLHHGINRGQIKVAELLINPPLGF